MSKVKRSKPGAPDMKLGITKNVTFTIWFWGEGMQRWSSWREAASPAEAAHYVAQYRATVPGARRLVWMVTKETITMTRELAELPAVAV